MGARGRMWVYVFVYVSNVSNVARVCNRRFNFSIDDCDCDLRLFLFGNCEGSKRDGGGAEGRKQIF